MLVQKTKRMRIVKYPHSLNINYFFLILIPLAATKEPAITTTPKRMLFKSGNVFNNTTEKIIDHAEYVIFKAIAFAGPILLIAL